MKRLAIVALVFFSIALYGEASLASQAVDPLRRPPATIGSLEYYVGASYLTWSDESVAVSPGGTVIDKVVGHDSGLDVTLNVKLSRHLALEVREVWTTRLALVERSSLSDPEASPASETIRVSFPPDVAYGIAYSPWPDHPLDPTIRLEVNGGGRLALHLSALSIQDPTVLTARVGVFENRGEFESVEVSLGAGFVANDRVSLGATISHTAAPGAARVPMSVFGARLGYALDAQGKTEIGVTGSLYVASGATRVGFAAYWQGEAYSW